jgi:penicillin-binding protein 2
MSVMANGGFLHQARLVLQVQSIDNKVVAAYPDRIREQIPVAPDVREELRRALVGVTSDGMGTAHQAAVKGIEVAGKTGTAQWGPTDRQRIAAWFAGFLPADNPKYSFAALYEGEPGVKTGGGSHAAPLIGKLFREIYKTSNSKKATPASAPQSSPTPEPEAATPAAIPVDESN